MVQMFQQSIANRETSRWLPAVLVATVALYFIGYVDGTAQGAFLGGNMAYVHEAFHHARHVALMCH
ncbi:MAG: CbtB-domain containing protein [Chloroflexi bacterium]|nr:CbtB-domain containing protein [Chloroflexota bacterium]MCH8894271.1 CbtB-domain containing protein [Chloroflexota bacterium]MCI0788848.1 CbtB-domain containing protein [Chloroflexota bacterium]MCI0800767.1 CbtB-domain containing protein [Chloroflexota bacterium]MCI0811174.1 CbtB-domain containing protein [Chloroflexota bacterium]